MSKDMLSWSGRVCKAFEDGRKQGAIEELNLFNDWLMKAIDVQNKLNAEITVADALAYREKRLKELCEVKEK